MAETTGGHGEGLEERLIAGYRRSRAEGRALLHLLPPGYVVRTTRAVVGAVGSSWSDGGTWFALLEALLLILRTSTIQGARLQQVADDASELLVDFLTIVGASTSVWVAGTADDLLACIEAAASPLVSEDAEERRLRDVLVPLQLALAIEDRRFESFDAYLIAQSRPLHRAGRGIPYGQL